MNSGSPTFETCAGNFTRWGYNKETEQCEEFNYGGCKGAFEIKKYVIESFYVNIQET